MTKKLSTFAAEHKAFGRADDEVGRADTALRAQQAKVADADVVQDAAVGALASARVGEGASRTKPFAELGFDPPSTIQTLGYAKEAKIATKLANAAAKAKGAGAGVKRAAKDLERAAAAVLAALRPIDGLIRARAEALAGRVGHEQAWETSFAALKRATRVAEDDGERGLFAALFQDDARVKPKRAKPAAAPVATPAP